MPAFTFELDPPPGLDSDDSTYALPGRWATGSNVRFNGGRAEVIGGFIDVFDLGLSVAVRAILAIDRGGTVTLAYGLASPGNAPKLYVGSGLNTPSDRTPAGLATTHLHWSLAAWGTTLLASPGPGVNPGSSPGGTLYEQSGTSQATEVTQAPNNITRMIVTLERQVLALGCSEEGSGVFNGRCIRGCDLEDYSDWSSTSTNNAFEMVLDGAGNIISGTQLGAYVMVWTESALYLGQFLGNPAQTYRFDKIAENCGICGPHAFAVLNERLFWIGTDLLPRTYVVGSSPEIIPFPLVDVFRPYVDMEQIVGTTITRFKEVRFYYNEGFIALSVPDGAWSSGSLVRTAAYESGLLQRLTTDSARSSNIAGRSFGRVVIDEAENDTNNAELSWSLQSGDQYIESGRRRVMVRRVVPDFEGQRGNVSMTIYTRRFPGDSPTTHGPYTLTAESSGWVLDAPVSTAGFTMQLTGGSGGAASGRKFTIAGVNAWENGADSGSLMIFTLTEDFQGSDNLGSASPVDFTPAINDLVDDPDRNVVTAPADGAAVTFLGSAGKKDFRASGCLMSVKFEGTSENVRSYVRFGKPSFDCVAMGAR